MKIEYSPIHPADIVSLYGQYGTKKELPFTPGLEGCGTVVESGGGFLAWLVQGKRVAVVSSAKSNYGCWQQYLNVNAAQCIAIPNNISFE